MPEAEELPVEMATGITSAPLISHGGFSSMNCMVTASGYLSYGQFGSSYFGRELRNTRDEEQQIEFFELKPKDPEMVEFERRIAEQNRELGIVEEDDDDG